jgi:osmotically-inducible protein OsmY
MASSSAAALASLVTGTVRVDLRTWEHSASVRPRPIQQSGESIEEVVMTDRELRDNVQSALDWEPSVDPAEIGVTVDNGVVTLRGEVKTYGERETAEHVALRVCGVKAVANDLDVRLTRESERTDSEIAEAAVNALRWDTTVQADRLSISVRDGRIILKGKADWQFQKDAATRAVRYLTGVRGVTNHVAVQPRPKVGDIQAKIEAAFRRSAEIDARRVKVTVQDSKVTLTGNVRSWAERQEAKQAAWAAPGVAEVEDCLAVIP